MGPTSTVIGCLLGSSDLDYDTVIARLAELRAGTRKARSQVPQSHAQHEVLRGLCEGTR
jgi:hypothetical protein